MGKNYAHIDYNPNDPDDVTLSEVFGSKENQSEYFAEFEKKEEEIRTEEVAKILQDNSHGNNEANSFDSLEDMEDNINEINLADSKPPDDVECVLDTDDSESAAEECEFSDNAEMVPEPCDELAMGEFSIIQAYEEIKRLLASYNEELDRSNRSLLRLEKKFSDEILNSESRDNMVKTIYKELNDYKAGLIEKALKNVLYDIVDIRETMLTQIKYIREKKGEEIISLDEFESYASDLADILEKHDVTIYKGTPGAENIAVRQKIVKKVETEDDALVKTVVESLSCGYEYNSKVLYPEKISIYVKKK